MTVTVKLCEVEGCEQRVAVTDNGVVLNFPADTYDEVKAPWTIMQMGPMDMACVGDRPPSGLGHSLHEHGNEE